MDLSTGKVSASENWEGERGKQRERERERNRIDRMRDKEQEGDREREKERGKGRERTLWNGTDCREKMVAQLAVCCVAAWQYRIASGQNASALDNVCLSKPLHAAFSACRAVSRTLSSSPSFFFFVFLSIFLCFPFPSGFSFNTVGLISVSLGLLHISWISPALLQLAYYTQYKISIFLFCAHLFFGSSSQTRQQPHTLSCFTSCGIYMLYWAILLMLMSPSTTQQHSSHAGTSSTSNLSAPSARYSHRTHYETIQLQPPPFVSLHGPLTN